MGCWEEGEWVGGRKVGGLLGGRWVGCWEEENVSMCLVIIINPSCKAPKQETEASHVSSFLGRS